MPWTARFAASRASWPKGSQAIRLGEPKELVEIDRAGHLFDGQSQEVGDALEDLLGGFSCRTP